MKVIKIIIKDAKSTKKATGKTYLAQKITKLLEKEGYEIIRRGTQKGGDFIIVKSKITNNDN